MILLGSYIKYPMNATWTSSFDENFIPPVFHRIRKKMSQTGRNQENKQGEAVVQSHNYGI